MASNQPCLAKARLRFGLERLGARYAPTTTRGDQEEAWEAVVGRSVRAGSRDSSSDRASGSDFPVMVAGTNSGSWCTAIAAALYVYKRPL